MEGVGARLGRSSARYGPTTVFTGPVRRWKKKWVYVPPPNSNHHNHTTAANGGNSSSHLLLLKWTPLASDQTKDGSPNGSAEFCKDAIVTVEETKRKKFKYIPIVVLEEQKGESSEQMEDDDTKPVNDNTNNMDTTSKNLKYNEKPDINDIPVDDNQGMKKNQVERQDLNVSTLDLSLGFNGHDGDDDSDSKADES